MTRKPSLGGLLLAGAAAYGLYRASKMTPEQRSDLMNRGKKFVNDNLGGLKNTFGKQDAANAVQQPNGYAHDVNYGG